MHLYLQYGYTPLMAASCCGGDGCVQLLLHKGAQVDLQNKVSGFWDEPSVSSYHVPLCEESIM